MGKSGATFPQYRYDPLAYIRDVLKATPTPDQTRAIQAGYDPPHKVLVSSGHSVGKSTIGGWLVNWWFDTRDPGICLTTAPTDRQVKDILWKEVKLQRSRANLPDYWVGPKIPRLESNPGHFAHGFTARDSNRFQGQHSTGGILALFDEAEGVDSTFWQALVTMLDDESWFYGFYNPTGQMTGPHLAEQQADEHKTFRRITISCLDHPNVVSQCAHPGAPLPIPGAITLAQLRTMLLEDSMVLGEHDEHTDSDVFLDGVWYRPGPIAEARCLGRRSKISSSGLWGEELWDRMIKVRVPGIQPEWPVVIGCDVARYGDDHTCIMVRKGFAMLHCEILIKYNTRQVSTRLKELADQFKDGANAAKKIPCMIDEGGIGGGVIDQHDGHRFVPINAGRKARFPERYRNIRSELWFNGREPALQNLLDVSRLAPNVLTRLKAELMVAKYEIIPGTDKVQVSSKDDMKAILKRSPDIADAFNLCLYPPPPIV